MAARAKRTRRKRGSTLATVRTLALRLYLNHPYLLVRLSAVAEAELAELLEQSWRRVAPGRLVAQLDDA
jgi:hypothetical protein